jgi:clan AA aspartic protease
MGMVVAKIEIVRGDDLALFREGYIKKTDIRSVTVKAIVDSGSFMLAINENIAKQLKLAKIDEKVVALADGSRDTYDVVGPVLVRFQNRTAGCNALVMPNTAEVLLGAIPMEEMDVLIDPKNQKLIVNPERPYIAGGFMVGLQ